jgi:hypothetical protein
MYTFKGDAMRYVLLEREFGSPIFGYSIFSFGFLQVFLPPNACFSETLIFGRHLIQTALAGDSGFDGDCMI